MMIARTPFVSLTMLVLTAVVPELVKAESCESLTKHASPHIHIVLAVIVSTASFSPRGKSLANLPPFCRITAKLTPTSDSDITSEIWLPLQNWNGKYLAIGSGGWGGSIAYEGMAEAVRRGYATSATDDGHPSPSARDFMNHPQKLIDFAYRAEHETIVESKSLITIFYGQAPRYSYWNGCSGGGREGLLQAYRYPDEFNGIIAGDPADIRRNSWALWLAVHTFKYPADYIPPGKYSMLHQFVLDACDAVDGLKDGLIGNPEKCHVDFKALQCKGGDGPNCLTPRQVRTAQTIVSPATIATGEVLFPRLEPGTELRWARLAGGPVPADLFLDEFRYLVYRNPQWNWRTFDLARDAAKAHAIDKNVDELDPHLASFAKHGGKLLLYHGWADQQVAPGSSIAFYRSAMQLSGDPAHSGNWIRLFMVPGMAHCGGGEGPDIFDKISVMEQWAEHDRAPARIVAAHKAAGSVERTRPLCPYPEIAQYNGNGSIDDAANFTCRLPG